VPTKVLPLPSNAPEGNAKTIENAVAANREIIAKRVQFISIPRLDEHRQHI
jgi:hypothetical protein